MAITRSSAGMTPIPPSPGRFQSCDRPWALASDRNCQVSHSSDSTTSGSATRAITRRTSCTMEPLIRAMTTPPQTSVATMGHQVCAMVPDWRPMATVASRITTSSNVPQPTSWTMLRMIGRLANRRPNTECIRPALARPLSQAIFAIQPSRPAPISEPHTMANSACCVLSAGIRYAPTCITSKPTPRLNQREAWSCQRKTRRSADRGANASLVTGVEVVCIRAPDDFFMKRAGAEAVPTEALPGLVRSSRLPCARINSQVQRDSLSRTSDPWIRLQHP